MKRIYEDMGGAYNDGFKHPANTPWRIWWVAAVCMLWASSAFSQATYTYTGGALISSGGVSGALTGSFTLPTAIGPNQTVIIAPASASFNIGVYTGSPPIVVSALSVTTDAGGNIERWSLSGGVTFGCSCSELFQSTGYLNGGGVEVFYTVKAYTPTTLDMASTGDGTWSVTVVAPPPPTNVDVLYCVNGSSTFKVMPASNSTSSLVRPGTTSAGQTCALPSGVSPSWYVQITKNGGDTWSWVTLQSIGLGN